MEMRLFLAVRLKEEVATLRIPASTGGKPKEDNIKFCGESEFSNFSLRTFFSEKDLFFTFSFMLFAILFSR